MGIIIAGWLDFDSDAVDRMIIEAKPLIDAALAERGCLSYDWSLDAVVASRVHVFEEWTDEVALAAHFSASAYADMGARLYAFGLKDFRIQKYRFDIAEPVYDPEGLPRADFFTA